MHHRRIGAITEIILELVPGAAAFARCITSIAAGLIAGVGSLLCDALFQCGPITKEKAICKIAISVAAGLFGCYSQFAGLEGWDKWLAKFDIGLWGGITASYCWKAF